MAAELGERIRAARLERGRGLRATAAEAAISPSLLSQVETGKVQPSVSTLYAIASCLGLSVDDILGHRPPTDSPRPRGRPQPVQRRADAPEIVMENGVTWRGLAVSGTDDGLSAVIATYAPGAASSLDETHMRHVGIEHGLIMRGQITLKLDFETYVLGPGDSLCFDSMRPHYYVNHTDDIAEGVWFIADGGVANSAASAAGIHNAVDVLGEMGRRSATSDSAPATR